MNRQKGALKVPNPWYFRFQAPRRLTCCRSHMRGVPQAVSNPVRRSAALAHLPQSWAATGGAGAAPHREAGRHSS
jgi:hypothetical protein